VGVIPTGTGNGFAASNLFPAGEPCTPLCATLALVRGRLQRADVVSVAQNSQVLYRCMLSWAWGLVADTDIEADDVRYLGPIRTTFQGVANILRRRVYRGQLRLLLAGGDYMGGAQSQAGTGAGAGLMRTVGPDGWMVLDGGFVLIWAMTVTHAATDMKVAPHKRTGDGTMDVVVVRDGASRAQLTYMLLQLETGKHVESPCVEYYKVRWQWVCSLGVVLWRGCAKCMRYSYVWPQISDLHRGRGILFCHGHVVQEACSCSRSTHSPPCWLQTFAGERGDMGATVQSRDYLH
jgi:hypothetical protein